MTTRTYLSIGDVLSLLRAEFPDITISKIRFLESQGLVNPERSPSGYRKFYDHDVERLRWVLRQQREHFLPLKVIRDRLVGEPESGLSDPEPAAEDDAGVGSGHVVGAAPTHRPAVPQAVGSRSESEPGTPMRVGAAAPVAGRGASTGTALDPEHRSAEVATARPRENGDARTRPGPGEEPARVRSPVATLAPAYGSPAAAQAGEPGPEPSASGGPVEPPGSRDVALRQPVADQPAAEQAGGTGPHSSMGTRPAGAAAPGGARAPTTEAASAAGSPPPGSTAPTAGSGRPGRPAEQPGRSEQLRRPEQPGRPEQVASGPPPTVRSDPAAGPQGGSAAEPGAPLSHQREGGGPEAGRSAPLRDPSGAAPGSPADTGSADDPRRGSGQRASSRSTSWSGETGAAGADPSPVTGGQSGVSLTLDELCAATGLLPPDVAALESYSLVSPLVVAGVPYYDEEALTVANLVAEFGRFGIEPRHLRLYRNAVDREMGLIEQIVTPLLRQRNPESRQRAVASTADLARLGQSLRASLLRRALRDQLGG